MFYRQFLIILFNNVISSQPKYFTKIYLANRKLFSNFEFSQKFIAIAATHLHINIVLATKLTRKVEIHIDVKIINKKEISLM